MIKMQIGSYSLRDEKGKFGQSKPIYKFVPKEVKEKFDDKVATLLAEMFMDYENKKAHDNISLQENASDN